MEKICAIISGGKYTAATGINECDYIIACDHGYEHARRMEVGVDLLLGDFDSYAGTLPQDVEILRLPVEKHGHYVCRAPRTEQGIQAYPHILRTGRAAR